jgi:hypothetical protein
MPPDTAQQVLHRYPLPIAAAYHAVVRVRHVGQRGTALGHLLDSLLHYLAAVAASAYLRSDLPDDDANRHLLDTLRVDRWSTGTVLNLLRAAIGAVRHSAHVQGGPDFLVEIESPGDDSKEKVPFYGQLGVWELLLIHRDKRTLRLLRLAGQELVLVPASLLEGKRWLVSTVLPLAFRRKVQAGKPVTELRRTDGKPGVWTV